MQRGSMTAVFWVWVVFLLPVLSHAAGTLPPNVKKYPDPQRHETKTTEVMYLYTKDAPAKVIDYYRKTLGTEPVEPNKFLVGQDVFNPGRRSELDSYLWLNISGETPTLRERDLFEKLDMEINMEQNPAQKQKLQGLRKKYAYLVKGWYPDFDARKKLTSCSKFTQHGKDKRVISNRAQQEDMARRMQELIAQGRYQEASELARGGMTNSLQRGGELAEENMKRDSSGDWEVCLKEVDRRRYLTRISVDLLTGHFKPAPRKSKGQ